MAASAYRVYREAKKYIMNGTIDLDATTLRAKLVSGASAALVSNYTRSTYASCGTKITNTNELSLTTIAITALNGSNTQKFDAADLVFTASGGNATSAQYLVIGVSGGKAICWCKLTTTAVTITSTLTVTQPANGLFTLHGGEA